MTLIVECKSAGKSSYPDAQQGNADGINIHTALWMCIRVLYASLWEVV